MEWYFPLLVDHCPSTGYFKEGSAKGVGSQLCFVPGFKFHIWQACVLNHTSEIIMNYRICRNFTCCSLRQ
eukprot:3425694-Amphidinium_carterae.1